MTIAQLKTVILTPVTLIVRVSDRRDFIPHVEFVDSETSRASILACVYSSLLRSRASILTERSWSTCGLAVQTGSACYLREFFAV